jgi:hypothetical protein
MQRFAPVLAAVALLACGGKKDSPNASDQTDKLAKALDDKRAPKQARKPTGTPRPQSKLTVTYDGKPLEMATALAWKSWDGTVTVTASSVPVGCDEVTGTMRSHHEGEVSFDVAMAQVLQPDGAMKPEIRQTYFSGMTSQLTAGPTVGTGEGEPGKPTTIEVDFKTEGVGSEKHELEVKGTIDALGCATPPPKDAPPPLPPEMPATIEIAGKKLPIRGARIDKIGDWPQLVLTTGGEGCKQVAYQRDGDFRVELTWMKPNDPSVSQVSLGGLLLKQASDQTFDKKQLTVKPAPLAPGELEIKADIVVMKYPVKIEGKVTAVACPK